MGILASVVSSLLRALAMQHPPGWLSLTVTVPPGLSAGMEMQFAVPDGQFYSSTIPAGVGPGESFVVQVPAAPQPPSLPMGQPVSQTPMQPPEIGATAPMFPDVPADEVGQRQLAPAVVRQLTPVLAPQ